MPSLRPGEKVALEAAAVEAVAVEAVVAVAVQAEAHHGEAAEVLQVILHNLLEAPVVHQDHQVPQVLLPRNL